jgi:FAD/FMN-containing dehydrogenase
MRKGLISELESVLTARQVLSAEADLQHYGRDWTRQFSPAPGAVVLPETIAEVQAIVRWANASRVPLVPSAAEPVCPAVLLRHVARLWWRWSG